MLYVYYVLPNIWKVLKHYESLGVVTLHPFSPAGDIPTHPVTLFEYYKKSNRLDHYLQFEHISRHDCFYR